ncbi:MAG TPA: c-type cytochrome [Candidatus Azoamicus sp. OHIO1]
MLAFNTLIYLKLNVFLDQFLCFIFKSVIIKMLSKSDSLKIFTVVTVTAVIVFLFLSYDTLKRIPDQTNAKNLTESVIRGKNIWESNNCMGCHTILGEGAYYAPELTKVYTRRSEEFIRIFLKDPQAMYPGKRKMVRYNFSDGEIDDLISFLKWINEIDCNGFPAEPLLKKYTSKTVASNVSVNVKRPEIVDKLCLSCHTLNGIGNKLEAAPIFDNIGDIRDRDYIERWLKDPNLVKKGALMPKFPLSDATISELSEFLSKQKSG